jgi:hypothetical protein
MAAILKIDSIAKAHNKILMSLRMLRGMTGAAASSLIVLPTIFIWPLAGLIPFSLSWFVAALLLATTVLILCIAFQCLRNINAGSVKTTRNLLLFLAFLGMVVTWRMLKQVVDVHHRAPLMIMEFVALGIFVIILFLATRGLVELIRSQHSPHFSLLTDPQYVTGLRTDIYRLMGIPIASNNRQKKAKKALAWAVAAFLLEGSVFYVYFDVAENIHKTVVRFRDYEVRHAEQAVTLQVSLLTLASAMTVGFVSAKLFLFLAKRLRRRSRRLLVQSYEELRESDGRAPVLFLRPFRDDQISLESAHIPWYMRTFDPAVEAGTLEELLIQKYSHIGPLLALGNPSDELPPIGAARKYVNGNEWRDVVLSLMQESSKIIIAVADTDSMIWEIENVSTRGYLDKTVFVLPPQHAHDVGILSKLAQRTGGDFASVRQTQEIEFHKENRKLGTDKEENGIQVIAASYNSAKGYFLVTSGHVTEVHYDVAIRAAILHQASGSLGNAAEGLPL